MERMLYVDVVYDELVWERTNNPLIHRAGISIFASPDGRSLFADANHIWQGDKFHRLATFYVEGIHASQEYRTLDEQLIPIEVNDLIQGDITYRILMYKERAAWTKRWMWSPRYWWTEYLTVYRRRYVWTNKSWSYDERIHSQGFVD